MLQPLWDGLYILGEKWTLVLGAALVTCLGCSLGLSSARTAIREKEIPRKSILLLIAFFAISGILRLAFVAESFVPPYFDSVEHYRIVGKDS